MSTLYDHVIAVDADGIPTLGPDAPDVCENEMHPDTPVRVYGAPNGRRGPKTEGFLAQVRLQVALRDVERQLLTRIGARAFQVTTLQPAVGPGLTGAQARRAYLADQRIKAGV